MLLLAMYTIFVTVGELFAAFVGLYLDNIAPSMSLPIALTLVFGVLVLAWPIAVYVTDRWSPENEGA